MSERDVINGFLEQFSTDQRRTVDVAKQLVDGKEKVEVALRREIVEPVRMESQPREHRFASIDGFIEYVNKYGSDDTVVLADPSTGCMTAVLDEASERGRETIYFEPVVHPYFEPWSDLFGESESVKHFAKFLLQNKHTIAAPDFRQLALVFSQIRVSKKVEAHCGVGNGAINGVTVETKISGAAQNTILEIPDVIVIDCPVFVDTESTKMEVSVLVEDAGGGPVVELACSDATMARIVATEEMLAKVQNGVAGVVSLGRIQYSHWSYLREGDKSPAW